MESGHLVLHSVGDGRRLNEFSPVDVGLGVLG